MRVLLVFTIAIPLGCLVSVAMGQDGLPQVISQQVQDSRSGRQYDSPLDVAVPTPFPSQGPVNLGQDLPQIGQVVVPVPENPTGEMKPGDLRPAEDALLHPDPRGEIERIASLWDRGSISDRALASASPSQLDIGSRGRANIFRLDNHRSSITSSVNWVAPNIVTQPTYFEDLDLEVYGYQRPLQSVRSGVRFYGNVLLFPWEVIRTPPKTLLGTAGVQRPGSRTPSVKEDRRF